MQIQSQYFDHQYQIGVCFYFALDIRFCTKSAFQALKYKKIGLKTWVKLVEIVCVGCTFRPLVL